MRILRHGGCYEAARAVRSTYVLSLLEDAEDRHKEEWIEALGRSTDKPRKEYCEEQGHSQGVANNPNLFSLKQVPLGWKEHIFHTGSSFKHNSVPEKGQWAGGLSLRSARHPSFLSALNRQESSSRQRSTDWKGLDDEPRMVLYSLLQPTTCSTCNLVFHQHSSDATVLYDKMPANALRNSPTAPLQEAALCEQIDLCIPGLPEIPHTEDEKAKKQVFNSSNKSMLINNYAQERQKTSKTIFCHLPNQRCMVRKPATWNDTKS